jgi:hypothetical protein
MRIRNRLVAALILARNQANLPRAILKCMKGLPLLTVCCVVGWSATGCHQGATNSITSHRHLRIVYGLDRGQLDGTDLANLDTTTRRAMETVRMALTAHGYPKSQSRLVAIDQFELLIPNDVDLPRYRRAISTKTFSVQLLHAKTMSTDKYPMRRYSEKTTEDDTQVGVSLVEAGTGKVVRPGDPEYANILRSWGVILADEDIDRADTRPSGSSYIPTLKFSASGTRKMTAWSSKYYNTGEKLAFVVDGEILSVSPLAMGAFIKDAAEINGSFKTEFVSTLVKKINGSRWPKNLKVISEEVVNPVEAK